MAEIITDREKALALLRADRVKWPAHTKNRDADLAAGDVQCTVTVRRDKGERLSFCRLVDGHEGSVHTAVDGWQWMEFPPIPTPPAVSR